MPDLLADRAALASGVRAGGPRLRQDGRCRREDRGEAQKECPGRVEMLTGTLRGKERDGL
ncbi:MAG: hypothetical protein WKF75_18520 [Singulisphaera sp.]